MGHLIITTVLAIIGVAFAILVSAAGKLIAEEVRAWAPRLTKGLIAHAIAMLPEDQRRRYGEEWLSHINEVPGELSQVFVAARLIFAARRILPALDESSIYDGSLTGLWAALKRSQDVVLALLLLTLASPAMLAIAAAIKFTSPGPVMFPQIRLGLNNDPFAMLKFRTMIHVPGPELNVSQIQRNDPRVTRIGRFLRRTSLDELPQLLNVLSGSMSLVGPRPLPFSSKYAQISGYQDRYRVKPGITGWAQVNGCVGLDDTPEKMQRRVDYDLAYVKNFSPLHDLRILLKTILFVILDRNRY